ncbi:tetratricopeptide repeat protein [Streptomyces sp. NBC_00289]|uniref:AfsR/SARP family transcriptional regulator n=1 Tax=Streptomyces sp. NBC_00289 TaxID=2975703 RepID=UPI0032499AAA
MIEVRLLGSVEVWGDGRRLRLGGKPLTVLSALVVHLGEVLATGRLVDLVWEEQAPVTATALVASHVSAARRELGGAPRDSPIRTRAPGYVCDLDPGRIDSRRFETLLREAERLARQGRAADAAEVLSDALDLWRGPDALEGMEQSFARIEAARLGELRLVAHEERFGLGLVLGRDERVIAPLLAHVAAHPLRERPRGQLMTALFRTGRVPDALRVYRQGRDSLREELGIEPGAELRALHRAVLNHDDTLLGGGRLPAGPGQVPARPRAALVDPAGGAADPPLAPSPGDADDRPDSGGDRDRPSAPTGAALVEAAPLTPSHLPPDVADFVGRDEEADWAADLLRRVQEPGRTAPPIAVISGRSGVGKTALAVHVGHRTATLFPDGRLFLDLRASDSAPVQASDALARLLRALGVDPEQASGGPEDLVGLYRTHVAPRRILLILDNAADESHLRPLLPPGAGCAVLITSRRRLAGLEGAQHLDLAAPDERDALELLTTVAGPARTEAGRHDLAEIVALCGRLPLALRIAGARLAARPHWPPGRLAARLRDERQRVNELRAGDLELRTSLELAYSDLRPKERAALRRLALMDLPDFASWIASPLLDIDTDDAEEAVERLVDCHFVDVLGVDGTGRTRYRIHDLVREHARERCLAEESPAERTSAVLRLVSCWLGLADQAAVRGPGGGAARLFPPHRARHLLDDATAEALLAQPAAWFAAEQACLVAAVTHCADQGMTRAARDLAGALIASSAVLYNQFDAWSHSHTVALEAVRRTGDRAGEAWLLLGLGQLRYEQDRFEEGYLFFAQALGLFDEALDPLDDTARDAGPERTVRADATRGRAAALAGMGTARREQARFAEALGLLQAALPAYEEVGDVPGAAGVLSGIGYVHREQGRPAQAWAALERCLGLYRSAADRRGEALALRSLALCHRAAGELDAAERLLQQAMRIFDDLGDRFGRMYTGQALAKVRLRQGRLTEAQRLDDCLEVTLERQDRFGHALVLRTIGEWHLAAGDARGAQAPLRLALETWETLRLPLWQARTVWDLAEANGLTGDEQAAREGRAKALEMFRALDSREATERGRPG